MQLNSSNHDPGLFTTSFWGSNVDINNNTNSSNNVVSIRWLEDVVNTTNTSSSNSTTNSTSGTFLSDGQVLRTTFTLYGTFLVVTFTLFCIVRIKFPHPYTIRKWEPKLKTRIANDQFGYFSWIWKMNQYTDDEILEECGMDSLCYLRLLKMGFRISCVSAFNAIWLMPIYKTAEQTYETENNTDPIVQVSITNLPSGSNRFLATVVAAYVLFGYIMYLILEEFKWFIEWRHRYLRIPRPRNYSIYVRNIPLEYRTNGGLRSYFERCLGAEHIVDAHLAVNAPKLRKAVTNRDLAINQLEYAVAYEDIFVKDLYMRIPTKGDRRIRAIEYYAHELNTTNEYISKRIDEIDVCTTSSSRSGFNPFKSIISGDYNPIKSLKDGEFNPLKTLREVEFNPIKSFSDVDFNPLGSLRDGDYYACGFVSFNNLCTTNAALQMIHHETPFDIEVHNAPDPEDIYWENVGLTHKEIQVGALISAAGTVALCLFWTIPMAFISTISSVETLKQNNEFIAEMILAYPGLEPLLQQMAPLLVIFLKQLLPYYLRFLSMREGPVSASVVEASLFTKLAAFTIIQTFFVSFLGGSVIPQLRTMMEDPWEIIDLLAEVLPQKSSYFIQIVFVTNAVSQTFEILRILPLSMSLLRTWLPPQLTKKQRRTTSFGIPPLCEPWDFQQSSHLATVVLNYMVMLVYAVIAPITAFIVGFGFVFMYICCRHQVIYIYSKLPDSGGKIWANFIKVLMSCMVISQVTIIGLLSLKKAAVTPLMIPLITLTVLFNGYVRQQHFRVGEFLPTRQCLKIDLQNGPDFDLSFLNEAYRQKELKIKMKFPELTPTQLSRLERHGVRFVQDFGSMRD